MKHIYLNLKRFDVPKTSGGVNSLAKISDWASHIVQATDKELSSLCNQDVEFVQFYPEAHILHAVAARAEESPIHIGCQGIFTQDTELGGNFGAMTTFLPASAAEALGCTHVLIGHCEERRAKEAMLKVAGVTDFSAVNVILNQEVRAATKRKLKVLFCIGETSEEQVRRDEVLCEQLKLGLKDVDMRYVTIAYEPVWSIGPGKEPASRDYIQDVAKLIKSETGGIDVVYGGGLKKDNAQMLASIEEIDGGLIALTRFQGEIGFYPDEYLEIIRTYLGK